MQEFIKEYFEQHNCGTRYPIYFTIRDVRWECSYHFSDGDRYILVSDTEVIATETTLKELFAQAKKDYEFEYPDHFDSSYISEADAEEFVDLNGKDTSCHIFAQKKEWEEKHMFLLSSEARQHLAANKHHYSKEAYVYCSHAWRAPRQDEFFNGLKKLIADAKPPKGQKEQS